MPSWSNLQKRLKTEDSADRGDFIESESRKLLKRIASNQNRNVIYYASGFLDKPEVPSLYTSINFADINGFMAGVHNLDFKKGLLLILHTPGGQGEAAQTIVDYLRSKFSDIDVLVPTYAMSAGTMIALGCDRIIMGRQSQLGPTDPQLIVGDRAFSAHSIVAQFEEAKKDISKNPTLAHAWAPVLRSFGPALLLEARRSISYGETLVTDWLTKYMFADKPDAAALASDVADFFGGDGHGSHGRRIDREQLRAQQLKVVDLEDNQKLQDDALTLYHLSTIAFQSSPAVKSVFSNNGNLWVRNLSM